MSKAYVSPTDRIIEAIKQLNAGWKDTDHDVRAPETLGKGKLYTVVFKGQDGVWRENYVFECEGKLYPYNSIREVLKDSKNGIISRTNDPEFIKLIVVSILTFIFAISVVGIVIYDPDNKSLQVLTGLLGLTLGYFVGKSDKNT